MRNYPNALIRLPQRRWIFPAFVLLCAALSDRPTGWAAEPPAAVRTYDGYTLEQWRARIKSLNVDDPAVGREVPGLLAIVEDEAAPWFSRRQAALTLGRIGAPAAAAVPVLERLVAHSPLAVTVSDTEKVDTDDSEPTPFWAIKALSLFGPAAAPATPTLIAVLHDPARSDLVRLATIEALARIGLAHPRTLPTLIDIVQPAPVGSERADQAVALERRVAAVDALQLLGGGAGAAVPTLLRAASDPSERLRRSAATTLGAIGPNAAPAIPTLADLIILDDVEEVRDRAAVALAGIGVESLPMLQMLLVDEDPGVRWRAADALRRLGSAAVPATADLDRATQDMFSVVRISALEALWAITGDGGVAMSTAEELADSDRQVRVRASRLLVRMEVQAAPALERLSELASDQSRPRVQQAARRTLQELAEKGVSGGDAQVPAGLPGDGLPAPRR